MASLRIVVVGATQSTLRIIRGLVRNGANVVGAFSLDPTVGGNVSGFATPAIESLCKAEMVPFQTFIKVNNIETVEAIRAQKPDVLFAVGFSQIVGEELLAMPSRGAVGFHPTLLPQRRGRAPLAWLAYDATDGAATFFVMSNGMDDGPILAQEPFKVGPDDHAGDVEKKILEAIDFALDRWVPDLVNGVWHAVPQDEKAATYRGIRRPSDGLIDWTESLQDTYAKIRAASRPHPGAYTYFDNRKIIVWRAKLALDMPWRGTPGRVLLVCPVRGVLIQAGEGLLWLLEIEDAECPQQSVQLKIGQKLGYAAQDEIFKLRNEVAYLKRKLAEIEG